MTKTNKQRPDPFCSSGFFKGLVPFQTSYTFPADRFNIFSFCAEAKSLALGTIPTGGVFTRFTNLGSSYGYGTHHIYHSAQFRASISVRYQYWDGLLTHLGLPSLAP